MNNNAKFFFLIFLGFFTGSVDLAKAQFATVTYDRALNVFGNYEALPSEEFIMFTGLAPAETDMVEVSVYAHKGKEKRKALARAAWRREQPAGEPLSTTFKVAMNYPLEAGKKYDLYIHYLALMNEEEKEELIEALMTTMDLYLRKIFEVQGKKIRIEGKAKEVYRHLNRIVYAGLEPYRFPHEFGFSGFSELVREHLESLEKVHVKKLMLGHTTPMASDTLSQKKRKRKQNSKLAERVKARELALAELEKVLRTELNMALKGPVWRVVDVRFLDDYPTRPRKGYFAVHLGYGAALIEQHPDYLDYGSSAYAGLSFPLATSRLAPVFMRNASLTAGLFFDNFTSRTGAQVSGPVFGRPFYLGLDYKLFQFVRFNAGASFLEMPNDPNNPSTTDMRVFVQPFIGISAKVNLSLSFDH